MKSIAFAVMLIFLFGGSVSVLADFEGLDAHQLVSVGIEYCKKASESWSDFKRKQSCTKAFIVFRKALKLGGLTKEELLDLYINRGACLGILRRHKEAIKDFDMAIGIESKDIRVLFNRGVAYANDGKKEKAIEDLEKVIEIDPDGLGKKAEEIINSLL